MLFRKKSEFFIHFFILSEKETLCVPPDAFAGGR